jgi:Asp-tRNA(Asn)/Glu-tRNA(Gln) amidotransferase A subunit family amidase
VELARLAASVRAGEVSAREVVGAALARIEAVDGRLGAFVAVDGERALAEAAAVDDLVARGEPVGPLAGVPVGVKDLEDAAGFRTSRGSLLHRDDPVASADSVVVARLRAAGAVVVGKTNTPEFGFSADTVNRAFPPSRNPWDLRRSPGGSSGGSAAAVAAGLVPLATGSDGGGSIRIPSALCGLTGLKPSLGRVPTGGRPADWPSLSTRGVIARTAADVAVAYDVVAWPEPTDLRSLPAVGPPGSWSAAVAGTGPPRAVAWSPTLGYATVDREVLAVCSAAVERLAREGVEVVEVDPVFEEDPVRAWLALVAASTLRRLEGRRGSDDWALLDPSVSRALGWAAEEVSATDFARAEDAGHQLNLRLVDVFRRAPLLLTPVVAGQTPVSGGHGTIDGVPDRNWVRFTYPFNLTRSPAGSVCAGLTADGMPVGLQVVGPQHADLEVLAALAYVEALLALDLTPPPLD